MIRHGFLIGVVATMVWSYPIQAQQRVGVTLTEALELARENNPAYRRAVADRRTASAQVRASYGAFLPSLSGSINFSGQSQTTVTGTDDFGEPVDLPDPRTFNSSSASQSLSSSITLFDGFQSLNNLRASQNRARATDYAVDSELNRIEAEVSRRFYDALRTQRLIEVEDRLLNSANEQLDATTRLFRVGSASQVDVLGAQVDVARQELEVERALGDARQSLLTLKLQIGIEDDLGLEVVGEFPEAVDPATLDVDRLVETAIRINPSVARAQANSEAAGNSLGAARGQRLPSISAGASFTRSSSLPDYDALFQFNPRNRAWRFSVSVDVPIFNRFNTSQSIAQARTQRIQADENLREATQQADQQVRAAYIDLQNAYQALQIERRSLDLSRQQLELAQEQYRLGVLNFQGLQQVLDRAAQAERQAVTAEYQYAVALVTLGERVGQPVQVGN